MRRPRSWTGTGVPLYEALSVARRAQPGSAAGDLPERWSQATLAAEDARFFRHPGVDPLAMARAVWHNLRALPPASRAAPRSRSRR